MTDEVQPDGVPGVAAQKVAHQHEIAQGLAHLRALEAEHARVGPVGHPRSRGAGTL